MADSLATSSSDEDFFRCLTLAQFSSVLHDAGVSTKRSEDRSFFLLLRRWRQQSEDTQDLAKALAMLLPTARTKLRFVPATIPVDLPPFIQEGLRLLNGVTTERVLHGIRSLRIPVPCAERRNRDALIRLVMGLTEERMTAFLGAVAEIKVPAPKRKAETDSYEVNANLGEERLGEFSSRGVLLVRPFKRQRLDVEIFNDVLNGPFLSCISSETNDNATAAFIKSTSSAALASDVCASCSRRLNKTLLSVHPIQSIPNRERLAPFEPHPAQRLTQGMLLYEPALRVLNDQQVAVLCADCLHDLEANRTPKLGLSNGLWLGEVPDVLKVLTLAERLLVSPYFPAAYVVKLFPKSHGAYLQEEQLNAGMRGNVTSYPLDQKGINDLVTGNTYPRPLSILSATIGITFIGFNGKPARSLPQMFRVSRDRVAAALSWLQENNPFFANARVDATALESLPFDEVPMEILQGARIAACDADLEHENGGYVPNDFEADDVHLLPSEVTPFGEERTPNFSDEISSFIPSDVHHADTESHDNNRPAVSVAPSVIPVMGHGMVDVGATAVTDSELFSAALANTGDRLFDEAQVKHGSNPVNEYPRVRDGVRFTGGADSPNHLLGCFVVLFPYGMGGLEVNRPVRLSYDAQVTRCLQLDDPRFRADMHFIFQTFGVIVKRQVCASAALQIKRSSYRRNADLLGKLTPEDLWEASKEEANHMPFSNPAIKELRSHLTSTRARVMGTDEHRRSVRSQIWGCTVMNGPPSLWVTINPSDTHDPVAQLLCGEHIDLDNFDQRSKPDAFERSVNIASNPMAAAQFFHHTVRCILKDLFGISTAKSAGKGGRGRIQRSSGILGRIQAYIGTVEAQGRGTLHLHLLLWLEGAPSAQVMSYMLQHSAFREKVVTFIDGTIHAHLPGHTGESIKAIPRDTTCSWSRPPDPASSDYMANKTARLQRLVRNLQLHSCEGRGCLRWVNGERRCKRRAPFPTAPRTWVDSNGDWGATRLNDRVVGFNPTLLLNARCNHDIKLLTNAHNTGALAWYITHYATKKQQASNNASAVLAKRLAYHVEEERRRPDLDVLNKRLLQRCTNALNREQEFSAPEVISLLMGWGDRYISHHYVPIYLDTMRFALRRVFTSLYDKSHNDAQGRADVESAATNTGEYQRMKLSSLDSQVVLTDQVDEYMCRGMALDDYSYLDFWLDTYHRPPSDLKASSPLTVPYLPGFSKTGVRQIRLPGHETMPQLIGQWFPRRDGGGSSAVYAAMILMFLKPWRTLGDLVTGHDCFEDALSNFESNMSDRDKRIIQNIDYFYLSSDAANREREAGHGVAFGVSAADLLDIDNEDDFDLPILGDDDVSDEAIEKAYNERYGDEDTAYAAEALSIAHNAGFFGDGLIEGVTWDAPATAAKHSDIPTFDTWAADLKAYIKNQESTPGDESTGAIDHGDEQEDVPFLGPWDGLPHVDDKMPSDRCLEAMGMDPSYLNEEQRRAYDLIKEHLIQTVSNVVKPNQLLMVVHGPGGTGKSALMEEVTKLFSVAGCASWLAKTATSGVAASRIGGQTLHSWAGIPGRGQGTAKAAESIEDLVKSGRSTKRAKNMMKARYLVIDEYSMMSHTLLNNLSDICCKTKCGLGSCDLGPFGGLNVILLGDLHQFPPIDSRSALYEGIYRDGTRAPGRHLYEQFTTVVSLTRQMRVTDEAWSRLLSRVRDGNGTAADIAMCRDITLSDPSCRATDFDDETWRDAILVTPRHSVKDAWNTAAILRHAQTTGHLIYDCPAEDTVGPSRTPLSRRDRLKVAGMKAKATGSLATKCTISVGMKAMVTLNVSTEADLANGSRGTVVGIVLDPRDTDAVAINGHVKLSYPPACVYLKLDGSTERIFAGLDVGVVPVSPSEARFDLDPKGRKVPIRRRQVPIVPAYAFTDYKSQGQTIAAVFIDLKQPPRKRLTAFNAYVALSRSHGRNTIRLLRDFDHTLLQTPPSIALIEDDARLSKLNRMTKDALAERLAVEQGWNVAMECM